MDIVDFASYLIKNIVKNPDMITVKSLEDEDGTLILEVLVPESDMGSVIGKEGKIAKALRTIISAHGYLNNVKKVKLNIDSF